MKLVWVPILNLHAVIFVINLFYHCCSCMCLIVFWKMGSHDDWLFSIAEGIRGGRGADMMMLVLTRLGHTHKTCVLPPSLTHCLTTSVGLRQHRMQESAYSVLVLLVKQLGCIHFLPIWAEYLTAGAICHPKFRFILCEGSLLVSYRIPLLLSLKLEASLISFDLCFP